MRTSFFHHSASSVVTVRHINYSLYLSPEELSWRKANKVPLDRKLCSVFDLFHDVIPVLQYSTLFLFSMLFLYLRERGFFVVAKDSKYFDVHLGCKRSIHYRSLQRHQLVNMFEHDWSFCKKESLSSLIKNALWSHSGDYNSFYPRCFALEAGDELDDFWHHFYLLRCVMYSQAIVDSQEEPIFILPEPFSVVKSYCEYLQLWNSNDFIDAPDFDISLQKHYKHLKQPFYALNADSASACVPCAPEHIAQCRELLNLYRAAHPQQSTLNGRPMKNIWICKPAAMSRGRGIFLTTSEEQILPLLSDTEEKWVVQKYIERPLIVLNRKFDIRQWVVVTNWSPLTVWFYEDCYLRFCSIEYDSEHLDNAFQHLSNNCVQKEKIGEFADSEIAGLMWHSDTFKDYLRRTKGDDTLWDTRIKNQMRSIVIQAMKATQGILEDDTFAFQLYGFDFMIDEDNHVWLIEINNGPDTTYSTKITEGLVKAALPPMMKIVLDYPDQVERLKERNRYPSFIPTPVLEEISDRCGRWSLIHKDSTGGRLFPSSLTVVGKRVTE